MTISEAFTIDSLCKELMDQTSQQPTMIPKNMTTGSYLASMKPRPYAGKSYHEVYFDDLLGIAQSRLASPPGLIETFSDGAWPEATVQVVESAMERRDPRHPNPAAGRIKTVHILVNGKVSKKLGNTVVALNTAERLHKKLVAALNQDQQKTNPNWGLF